MRVYIAGPMTGYPDHNFPAFEEATRLWRAAGVEVVSPVEVGEAVGYDPIAPWGDYMREDIRALLTCDAVATLSGWDRSRGAALEVHIARALGMLVVEAVDVVDVVGEPMTIRIHDDPRRHRLARSDADPRIAWTTCGIRFAWGPLSKGGTWGRCPECWA